MAKSLFDYTYCSFSVITNSAFFFFFHPNIFYWEYREIKLEERGVEVNWGWGGLKEVKINLIRPIKVQLSVYYLMFEDTKRKVKCNLTRKFWEE